MGKEKKVRSLVLLLCFSRHAGGAVLRVEMTTCSCRKREQKRGNKREVVTKTKRKVVKGKTSLAGHWNINQISQHLIWPKFSRCERWPFHLSGQTGDLRHLHTKQRIDRWACGVGNVWPRSSPPTAQHQKDPNHRSSSDSLLSVDFKTEKYHSWSYLICGFLFCNLDLGHRGLVSVKLFPRGNLSKVWG